MKGGWAGVGEKGAGEDVEEDGEKASGKCLLDVWRNRGQSRSKLVSTTRRKSIFSLLSSEMEANGGGVVDVPSSVDYRPMERQVRRICFRWGDPGEGMNK